MGNDHHTGSHTGLKLDNIFTSSQDHGGVTAKGLRRLAGGGPLEKFEQEYLILSSRGWVVSAWCELLCVEPAQALEG